MNDRAKKEMMLKATLQNRRWMAIMVGHTVVVNVHLLPWSKLTDDYHEPLARLGALIEASGATARST